MSPAFFRPPLDYPQMPYDRLLSHGAERHPENVAVVFQDASITYRELDALTDRFARALAALCIRGPQIMQGYWKAPEATAAALRGGWYYSGDRVRR